MIKNKSKCQIGGRRLSIDYYTLIDDLSAFSKEFQEPINDCEINDWLALRDPRSGATSLIHALRESGISVVDHLRGYEEKKPVQHISCTQCVKIGDAVIALEQPSSATLVHSDASLDQLCPALNKPHVKVDSIVGVERDADSDIPPL